MQRRSWRRRGRRRRPAIVLLAVAVLLVAAIAAVWLAQALLLHNAGTTAAAQARQVHLRAARTVVSLTFDDAYEDQWLYAVPLLRSHHMNATIYVITADSDGPHPCCMSWAQLRTLQGEGDDIGSHTIDHPNLTKLTPARIRQEVCGSRHDMLRSGIYDPESFAYPFGSFDPVAERIVAQCGFSNARQGGDISNSSTRPEPPWVETLPPRHPEAVSTIAPDGAQPITLPTLERFVTAAAAHGGWLPITFHNVCDAYADDFVHCMSTYGPILDTMLRQFLDWLRNAGRPGGAPAGVVVQTMRTAMNTWKHTDTTPPSAFALCDGSPCHPAPYRRPVRLALTATDVGGTGVARIYYTAGGHALDAASPVYQTPFTVAHTETIKFFAVDNAGNAERVRTLTVRVG
jgi:peptidoglycan/xylan/chitin deacetylase (PgdA/CDA1 family)